MATNNVSLQIQKDLINNKFNGYKLDLDKIPVYKQTLEFGKLAVIYFEKLGWTFLFVEICILYNLLILLAPEEVGLSSNQFGLLHAKAFGFMNLCLIDPWDGSTVYIIDSRWKIIKISVSAVRTQNYILFSISLISCISF